MTKQTYVGQLNSDRENAKLREFVNSTGIFSDLSHPLSYTLWRVWKVSQGADVGGMGLGSSLQLECAGFVDIADALLYGD